jgi:FkbM family methyltransferase
MIKSFRGHSISYDTRPEFWENLQGWEPETFDMLDRFLKPDPLYPHVKKHFLDIGAWNGVLSIYAGKIGAYPCAIEADPIALKEMRHLFELNFVNKTDYAIGDFAVSDKTGPALLLNEHDGLGNSMTSLIRREEKRNAVSCVANGLTLQMVADWFGLKPSLIKIDIEGAETLVIPSSLDFLEEAKCPLLISLHPYWFQRKEYDERRILDALAQVYDVSKTEKMIHDQYLFLP